MGTAVRNPVSESVRQTGACYIGIFRTKFFGCGSEGYPTGDSRILQEMWLPSSGGRKVLQKVRRKNRKNEFLRKAPDFTAGKSAVHTAGHAVGHAAGHAIGFAGKTWLLAAGIGIFAAAVCITAIHFAKNAPDNSENLSSASTGTSVGMGSSSDGAAAVSVPETSEAPDCETNLTMEEILTIYDPVLSEYELADNEGFLGIIRMFPIC